MQLAPLRPLERAVLQRQVAELQDKNKLLKLAKRESNESESVGTPPPEPAAMETEPTVPATQAAPMETEPAAPSTPWAPPPPC